MNAAVKGIKRRAALRQLLPALGAIPVDMTPAEPGAFLKSELAKRTAVIKTRGMQPE